MQDAVSEYHNKPTKSKFLGRGAHNLALALEYAEAGIPVFPCKDGSTARKDGKPDRGPIGAEAPNGFKDATTDPKTIKGWWRRHPYAVPGIPTGAASGLAVLDLDRKDGKDGVAAIKAWGFDPDQSSAAVIDTPSGGLHLIFRHRPGVRSSARHLPAGVDVKADGGFIFPHGAWNTVGRYESRSGDFLIDLELGLPFWPEALEPPAREAVTAAQGEPGQEDPETVRQALWAVPNDCPYPEWVEILMAIHHETGGSAEGLELAMEWSGRDDYPADPEEIEEKWRSFGGPGESAVTVGTIYRRAIAEGWSHPGHPVADDDFEDLDEDEDREAADLLGMTLAEFREQFGETESKPPAKAEWGAPMMKGDRPIINLSNTALWLGRNLDFILPGLAHNLMTGRDEWRDGPLDDAAVSLARMALEKRGLETVGKDIVADAAQVVARKRSWHPIRDYLDGLTWDGTTRLDSWLVQHVGAEDSPYVRAVGRKFLLQMVARVMVPGCKVDHTLVLSGPQGVGKSTLCRVLAGTEYFSDTLPSISGDKTDAIRHLHGKWLVELAELAPSRKSEAEDLKAFLSGAVDRVRLPYARHDKSFPRQCVFVGTTNEDQFLRDATGGRRFWPITVGKVIDLDALASERDQLFSEAFAAWRSGEAWHLDGTFEAEHARPVQAAARESDSWTEIVAAWLKTTDDLFDDDEGEPEPRMEVRLSEVLDRALGLSANQQTMAAQKRASIVMRDLGWTKHHTRTGKVWRSPEWKEPWE